MAFKCLQPKAFKNTVEKEEIALYNLENFLPIFIKLKLSPVNSFSLEASKICRLGKRLRRRSKGSGFGFSLRWIYKYKSEHEATSFSD